MVQNTKDRKGKNKVAGGVKSESVRAKTHAVLKALLVAGLKKTHIMFDPNKKRQFLKKVKDCQHQRY